MYQKYKHIVIEFKNNNSTVELKFKPRLENQITHRWIELLTMATQLYPIDQPDRFYGFNDTIEEEQKALDYIQRDINIINSNNPKLVERELTSVHDQDTLNYLHHIFEVHHGLLDSQSSEYWKTAPIEVREALADLNIDVHRCEHMQRQQTEQTPRFVTTWYGLPKSHHYFDEDYDLFTNNFKFGTIYLNYCEIGKTLEDLCKDKELDEHSYAAEEAFKPFDYFSADFRVNFYNSKRNDDEMWKCFDTHSKFFTDKGYVMHDKRLSAGTVPVADIVTDLSNDELIDVLKEHQYVSNVSVTLA